MTGPPGSTVVVSISSWAKISGSAPHTSLTVAVTPRSPTVDSWRRSMLRVWLIGCATKTVVNVGAVPGSGAGLLAQAAKAQHETTITGVARVLPTMLSSFDSPGTLLGLQHTSGATRSPR